MSVILNVLPQHMSHTLGMSTTVKDFVTVFVELFYIFLLGGGQGGWVGRIHNIIFIDGIKLILIHLQ